MVWSTPESRRVLLRQVGLGHRRFQISCDYKRQVALSSSKIRPLCTEIYKNRRSVTSEDEVVSVTLSRIGSIIILIYQVPSDSLNFAMDSIKSVSCIRGFFYDEADLHSPSPFTHPLHHVEGLALPVLHNSYPRKTSAGSKPPKQVLVFT